MSIDVGSRLERVARSVRYALRALGRSPGFTVTVVLTLALAVGANGFVFSAVNAILLEPLPFPNADRLVEIGHLREQRTGDNVAPVRLEDWNDANSTFEALTGYYTEDVSDTSGEFPERIRKASVARRFLDVWGLAPVAGRGFLPADHDEGAAPVALISARYWRRRFDSDPVVLDNGIRLGDDAYTVIGVLPNQLLIPDRSIDVWVPLEYAPWSMNRQSAWLSAFGRMKAGATPEQAHADLNLVQSRLAQQYPETDEGLSVGVARLRERAVGSVRASLWLLLGAVSVVLLIACTNIGALLLSRAAERRHAVSIRAVLGSSRFAIAAEPLTEAALLSAAGAVLGLGVAAGAAVAFRAAVPDFPRVDELALGGPILVYTLLATIVVTLACGLVPSARAAFGPEADGTLTAGTRSVSGRNALQWTFVGVQIALSVALLAAAALLLRSFQELSSVDPGFEAGGILSFRISGSYGEPYESMVQGIEVMLDELRTLPGVDAAATSSPVPGVLDDGSGFQFSGTEFQFVVGQADVDRPMRSEFRVVSPSYFDTLQIPHVAGEPCRRRRGDEEPTILVNETFVGRYLAGREPVGLSLRSGYGTAFRIVGVVGDAREYGPGRAPVPTAYACGVAEAYPPLAFLVRTSGDPASLVNAVRRRLKEIEPGRSVYDMLTLEQRIGGEYSQERLRTALIGGFAGAALLLACLGVYGTLSYVVHVRRREVGLRMALGAAGGKIVREFLVRAMTVVAIACAAGLVLSLASARLLSGMLYGVVPWDPTALSGVIVAVTAVAALAALIPAGRASRIEPMLALRDQ